MKLVDKIVKNQTLGLVKKNEQLIKIKLKELVFDYTAEVVEVLHKTGIPVSTVLPANVILTIVVKHLAKNNELRTVISKMLLELDSFYRADGETNEKGKNLTMIGGVLSTIGALLAGLGRGQQQNQPPQDDGYGVELSHQKEIEAQQKRRTIFIIVGASVFLLVAAVLVLISTRGKPVQKLSA